ncbi:hypothetical protein SFR_6227 [Streptomyces sp. FR-008]|nr:hypothetical protein SFR_6227 [Streptomyces sp. FR-008]
MPRIGALAPAILSHRSPRARDGGSHRSWGGLHAVSSAVCVSTSNTPAHRAARYRIAIR